mgnify:FL=1
METKLNPQIISLNGAPLNKRASKKFRKNYQRGNKTHKWWVLKEDKKYNERKSVNIKGSEKYETKNGEDKN